MSKKHKKNRQFSQEAAPRAMTLTDAQVEEYVIIKHDLIRLLVLNVIMLGAVLALYYTNLQSHYLDRWAEQFIHF